MEREKIVELAGQMTLEEKAGLCSGKDFWHTKAVERLGIPSMMLSDGPQGLRKQDDGGDHLGLGGSIEAVCFPAGCLAASSFDPEVMRLMGQTLGRECAAEGVGVILGPAMNIKRSPLCGRNFEYLSEDPCLTGEMAAAYVEGVQAEGVAACPKHFLANSQEHHRLTGSSNVDERTLREIYLPAFERVVTGARPWTLMASYNRVNGVFATESRGWLTDVLRGEWGFDGFVVSDWGAVDERACALAAGMELEMPASGGVNDAKIVAAVRAGELDEAVLDEACARLLKVVFRCTERAGAPAVFDREADHLVAQRIAEESMVLLKNEESLLPLSQGQKVAFIGEYAARPRYQGGGSSHINASKVVSALDAAAAAGNAHVSFARGFSDEDEAANERLAAEAVRLAEASDVAVLFVGLPESYESEGYDKAHLGLPAYQNALVEAVCEVQENVVVVLHNGSPVEMPWVGRVSAILESYLGGQAVGSAQYRILFGEVNPSGRLAETFPVRVQDNPTWPWYGREGKEANYREGVLVGYRHYDAKEMDVLFAFGHGLSYTEFAYSGLELSSDYLEGDGVLGVRARVENVGGRSGKEVAQLYVAPKASALVRPVRELRAFAKVELAPGESAELSFELDAKAFSYWDDSLHAWCAEAGEYELQLGRSSRDIALVAMVHVEPAAQPAPVFSRNSTLGEVLASPKGAQLLGSLFQTMSGSGGPGADAGQQGGLAENNKMTQAMLNYTPLRGLVGFAGMGDDQLNAILAQLNS